MWNIWPWISILQLVPWNWPFPWKKHMGVLSNGTNIHKFTLFISKIIYFIWDKEHIEFKNVNHITIQRWSESIVWCAFCLIHVCLSHTVYLKVKEEMQIFRYTFLNMLLCLLLLLTYFGWLQVLYIPGGIRSENIAWSYDNQSSLLFFFSRSTCTKGTDHISHREDKNLIMNLSSNQ